MRQTGKGNKKAKIIYPKKGETIEEKLERLINNFTIESRERQEGLRRYFIPRGGKKKIGRGRK